MIMDLRTNWYIRVDRSAMLTNEMLRVFAMIVATLLLSQCSHQMRSSDLLHPQVVVDTELGSIILRIDLENAPVTAGNFLRYVDEGRFQGASFYRVVRLDNQPNKQVKIEVIQGGLQFTENNQGLPPIDHESTATTGILHEDGTLSMARAEIGTASSEIFICIGHQPELDYMGKRNPDGHGFAAFGKVVKGMDVVRMIQQQKADGQMLIHPVKIDKVERR